MLLVIRLLAGRRGGAERVFAELASCLSAAGHEVICAYCDAGSAAPAYVIPAQIRLVNLYRPARRRSGAERLLGFLARPYPRIAALSPLAWLARNSTFIRGLRRLIIDSRPDAVISFLPSANTPSLLAGASARASVVVTNHGEPQEDYRSRWRWAQNPFDRWLRYRSLWLATRIQVMSQDHAAWFPDALRPRTWVIPNGLAAEFEALLGEQAREPCIVVVGRLVPEKEHTLVIEAFRLLAKQFPGWSVRIYGDGPERDRLADQIRSSGLLGRVHLMGQSEEIRAAYLRGEIFCHPAQHEGFGLAMLEALACGLPVVASSDCRAARDLVRHERNGLLVPHSRGPGAFAEALARLMSDGILRRSLGAAAPASAAPFSRQVFAARWCALLDSLPKGQPGTAPSAKLARRRRDRDEKFARVVPGAEGASGALGRSPGEEDTSLAHAAKPTIAKRLLTAGDIPGTSSLKQMGGVEE